MIVLCSFVIGIIAGPTKRGRAVKKQTDTRVYLQHADELTYDLYGEHQDAQFLKGHVSFLHKGAHLTCDSALYYQATNSFRAFGHVKMRQGDTLTLTSDYAYYDGNDEMAEARHNVILTHRRAKLFCDSLNYDRMYNIAYFFEGGKLVDKQNTLTSDWGQYNPDTRHAIFYYDVHLKNKNFRIDGDTLHYDTRTSKAQITGPSTVTSNDGVIYSDNGYYNTDTEFSELYNRSTIVRKDGRRITADSLYNNGKTGVSIGRGNVVFTDTINKNILLGDLCHYDENTGYGMATRNAVGIDYSQGDSLFVHGDTIKIFTYNINTDSVYRHAHVYNHVRAYRKDMQAVCDSMVMFSEDSCLIMYKDPIIWNGPRQILGEEIRAYMNDSTIRFAHVIGQALSVEMMSDSAHYNQVASKEMKAWFTDGQLRMNQCEGNVQLVYYPIDEADSSYIGLNYTETDTMRMYLTPDRRLEKIWMCKNTGTLYPMTQIPPNKYFLPTYAWFDYIRPLSKDDIFIWRPKKSGTELKHQKRRVAPRQKLEQEQPPKTANGPDTTTT